MVHFKKNDSRNHSVQLRRSGKLRLIKTMTYFKNYDNAM